MRHKKPNGTTYVYKVLERHWDKEKKQARSKQVCIGKLDPVNGEIIPSKRLGDHGSAALNPAVTATTTITGPSLLLRKADRSIGLSAILKKASPGHWEEILTLAWYLLCTGQALSNAEVWSRHHEVPCKKSITNQRISDLLDRITEDERQTFFKLWGQKIAAHDYLCYDITSVSSYAEQNEYVRNGYNRDREHLAQINLAAVYGQKSGLPVAYRILPGSINDVVTLEQLLDQFDKLEFPTVHLVMDRGFYSQNNIDMLCGIHQDFTIGIPVHLKWVQGKIDENRERIDCPYGLKTIDGEQIYTHTQLHSWGKDRRRCYLHFYFDPQKQVDDRKAFDAVLLKWQEELQTDKRIPENEEYYERFFTVHKTPKRGIKVTMNWDAVQAARKKYVGFHVLLSTKMKDGLEALRVYREKDRIEKSFDDLKNELDMKRLRVHSSRRMNSRLFVQFIALILVSEIRRVMREKELLGKYTEKSLMMELESLTTIRYTGKYKDKISEATKAQKEIMAAFEVEMFMS